MYHINILLSNRRNSRVITAQEETQHMARKPPCVCANHRLLTPHQVDTNAEFQGHYFLDLVYDLTFYASKPEQYHLIIACFLDHVQWEFLFFLLLLLNIVFEINLKCFLEISFVHFSCSTIVYYITNYNSLIHTTVDGYLRCCQFKCILINTLTYVSYYVYT